jgi:cytoskeletal protein CcmA (bactofilin family)
MFGRKRGGGGGGDDEKGAPALADDLGIPLKPGSRPPGAMAPGRAAPAAAAPAPRPVESPRAVETPPRPAEPLRTVEPLRRGPETAPAPTRATESDARRLIVGSGISLSGEITSCDRLVVEGSVEANLANCRDIEIAGSGLFKGSAAIDDAEISGRFEGNLTVRRRLLIRATGRVTGTVRYGQIEIECGGQISGEIEAQPVEAKAEPVAPPLLQPQPSQQAPIVVAMAGEAKR